MGIDREFQSYGAQLVNRAWAVSAVTADPREVVVSLWQHKIVEREGRWIYDDSLARWNGAGKNLLKEHLGVAYREGLRLRAVVATQHNRAERERNPNKAPRNTFKARPDWVGHVELLDGDHFLLSFDHVGETATTPAGAKYWRAAEAIADLGRATLAEVEAWDRERFPNDPLGNARADLELFTVNSASRVHYNYARENWRSDQGHPHDLLFKLADAGPPRRTHYVLFNPAQHGHWDLLPIGERKWQSVPLAIDEQARIEAEAQADAFNAPLDSTHDARVWAMRAVAQRRGHPLFRARLLDAYDRQCAITGCSALEVLEAAHVLPYRGEHTNRMDNGLLLRADLHTLFDCQLLWITAENTVALAPALLATDYASLQGRPLRLPVSKGDHPNPAHLAEHATACKTRHSLQ